MKRKKKQMYQKPLNTQTAAESSFRGLALGGLDRYDIILKSDEKAVGAAAETLTNRAD